MSDTVKRWWLRLSFLALAVFLVSQQFNLLPEVVSGFLLGFAVVGLLAAFLVKQKG